MKQYLFFLLATLLSISCNTRQDNLQIEISKTTKLPPEGTGQVPSDNPVMMMTYSRSNYTWRDLDAYYRGNMQQESEKHYFKNLKNLAFSNLVNVFNLPDQAPAEVVAYYVEEQAAMPYTPFVAEFVKCLNKLDGYWPKGKIRQFAQDRYEKTKTYYLNNEIWKTKWENEKSGYEALLNVK